MGGVTIWEFGLGCCDRSVCLMRTLEGSLSWNFRISLVLIENRVVCRPF